MLSTRRFVIVLAVMAALVISGRIAFPVGAQTQGYDPTTAARSDQSGLARAGEGQSGPVIVGSEEELDRPDLTAAFTEGFEGVSFPPAGWSVQNKSTTIGTNVQCWNRFTNTPWAPRTGVGHAGANFNCTSGANNISGWLISPTIDFNNGDTISFWTRKASPDSFADRLELRISLSGASTNTGATSTDVGDFTTLALSVNPTLVTGVYPTAFTQFTATISGLAGQTTGRAALRYFVTNGGPSGANSDIISIDDFVYTPAPPQPPCAQNFDSVVAPALPGGWTATTAVGAFGPWATSTSGSPVPVADTAPNSAFVNNPGSVSDERLDSPAFPINTTAATLTFRRNNETEFAWDGLVLEASINGGAFVDILATGATFGTGGYNVTLNASANPINTRQAWSGSSSGFVTTTVNLPASANGQSWVFRWRRGTDGSVNAQGVRIDTINVTGAACVSAASGLNIYGVTATNQLLLIDKLAPAFVTNVGTITGLGAGEQILGIDVRPATGELYGLGVTDNGATRTGRIFKINPVNAVATQVGAAPFSTTLQDTDFFGFNFNPRVDRIRVTNRLQDNLRVNPNDGSLSGTDTNLSIPGINGVAYDRNVGGAATTTLYALDFNADRFGTIGGINGTPSPNGGVYTNIGNTGIVNLSAYYFDIESVTDIGRVTANGNLYTANLGTGALTLVGAIAGNPALRGITHPQAPFTTSTSLTSSANASVFGQPVTFTATVATTPVGGSPTGTVQFFDNAVLIGAVPVTSSTATLTTSTLSVGNHPITANYVSSLPGFLNSSATLTGNPQVVNKANSAVSVQTNQNAPVYGQTTVITATLTAVAPGSGVPQGTVDFLDGATPIATCQGVIVSALGAAQCSVSSLGAGAHTINANYSGNANFNTSTGSVAQTIAKAPLNVTASSATVTYGDAVPAISSSITGFVLGETSAVLGTQPACSTTYTQGASAAGSQYPTSCTGAVAANYSFNYINGTVTVNKKALTVTADNKTRGYGAANPALTATFSGFIAGENLGNSGVTGSPLLTTTAVPTSPVAGSPYAITAAVGTLASANYSFATFVNGTLTITAAQLTVTADNKSRVFGAANPALTYQIAGFQNGETLATSGVTGTPAISTTATASSSPGTYPITVTNGTLGAPNYTFAFVNANLTVTQATTTTTITNSAALGSTTAVGQSYAVNWSTTPNAPGAGTPTGTVTVSDGTGATCSAAVAVGTCNLTSTTIGTKTITATYAGDVNFAGSVSQTVNHTVVIAMTGNVKQFVAFGTNTNLAGVTITISGTVTGTTITDAAGNYSFGLTALGGNYVLTPSGLGKTYEALSRTYNNVNGNIAGADFIAYDSPGPNAIPRTARLVSQIATQGQPVTLPILMSTTGAETRVSFTIEYPTTALGIPTVTCGSGTINCTLTLNNSLAGRMGVTITPTGPLTAGTAEIARITFPTFPSSASNAAIRFGDFPTAREVRNAENNPIPILYWTDGQVSFTGGTLLDGATLSGRVTTASGQGLRNASVTIIDSLGNRKTAVTSSFGAYTFEGLEVGRTYLITVNSKRFRFAARTVDLTGNLSNIDLVGLE